MAHTTKVVDHEPLSNGQHAFLIRCCDDPKTEHWHTIGAGVADPEASLNAAREAVAKQHEAMFSLAYFAKSVLDQEKQHG